MQRGVKTHLIVLRTNSFYRLGANLTKKKVSYCIVVFTHDLYFPQLKTPTFCKAGVLFENSVKLF